MKKVTWILVVCGMVLATGCNNQKYTDAEKMMQRPVNCATAEGDIRMLMHEKAHVSDEIAAGVSAISPAGFVIGMVSGTEGTQMKVASGDYDKMIDRRIQEIKQQCGIQ